MLAIDNSETRKIILSRFNGCVDPPCRGGELRASSSTPSRCLQATMLSAAHFTGTPPPLPQHSVSLPHSHHPPPVQTQFSQHQHGMASALLPTPPSSPAAVALHPIENTLSLLESLVAFYHQERMWVYRTRAQLEMDMMQRIEVANNMDPTAVTDTEGDSVRSGSISPSQSTSRSSPPTVDGQTAPNKTSLEGTSPSPPTKWLKRKKAFNLRLEGISTNRGINKPRPYPHRPRQGSSLNPAGPQPPPTPAGPPPHAFYPPPAPSNAFGPATTTLTSPYLCHPSFAATFGPPQPAQPSTPSASQPSPYSQVPPQTSVPEAQRAAAPLVLGAGGREPSVQILEIFEKMMQARMESCERVTRMVRSATNPSCPLTSVGGPVGAPGLAMNVPIVSGPVGGPGIGGSITALSMGVVPNGAYPAGMMQGHVYDTQNMTQEQQQSQSQGVQNYQMGVGMG